MVNKDEYILLVLDCSNTEDVILQLIRSKCLPALLYGLEACPLRQADSNSLDFVVNRLFMKLFKTSKTILYYKNITITSLRQSCSQSCSLVLRQNIPRICVL